MSKQSQDDRAGGLAELRYENEMLRMRAILDASPVPTALNDEHQRITYLNPAFVQAFGYTTADIPTLAHWWSLAYPDPAYRQWVADSWRAELGRARQDGDAFRSMELSVQCKDGTLKVVLAGAASMSGAFKGEDVVVLFDITERQRAAQALRESDQRFRDLVDSTDGIVWEADAFTFTFRYVSSNAERLLGHRTEDWLQPGFWAAHIHPEDRDRAVTTCAAATARMQDHEFEYRFLARDGRAVWLNDQVKVVREQGKPRWLRGLMVDVTERKREDEDLRRLLREKEALLKEVHHRIKNNLQVITSLLRLESGRSAQSETRLKLAAITNRIRSMALLHEAIYRSVNFATVDLGAYLRQLAQQSFRALVASPGLVRLELDLASVLFGMDQALPCGLLVNELISNSIQHGFPGGRGGEVRLVLQPVPGGSGLCLRVSDTGVGLPPDFEAQRGRSLGLQLVIDLARQLGGTLEIGPLPHATFTLIFTPAPLPSLVPPA